ncbi:ABC transporter substrate-binding protein [Rhizobium sp. L51/94]|uniref:ABC transporter substrate-binding protein n=1 Tax=Rhizobium sp. L51/94 TaxID=2819999 RepID=UPI001C5B0A67|nr:ABC transporter substrate-binding protein [Rhizobium sp. L51/94]QXZ81217.1 ABC transporter substrate-binding protein [Rhizobium sp. L51/94]
MRNWTRARRDACAGSHLKTVPRASLIRPARRLAIWGAVSTSLLIFGLAPAEAAKNSLDLGMTIEPSGLDPTIAAPVAIGQVSWQNIFEGLVAIDEAGRVQPQLAKGWEISPDGLTYTFHLQSGVKFHDGQPFDSTTAKFTLDRARGSSSVNPQKRFFTTIASIDTPDPQTLVLHLSAPTGSLLSWLGWPAAVMVAPNSAADDRTRPIGTGPFRFVSWAKGDRVELERNDNYWNKAVSVRLDKVTFRFISDPQAQAAALKSGGVDAIPEFAAPELMASFAGNEALVTRIGNTELKVVAGMNNSQKPFDDKRVRQALMMAIDRKTVVDGAWSGLGTPIGSHYTPNDPGFLDLTARWPYDPQKARALLADAGYGQGFSFTIKSPQMAYASRSAEIIQAMLADIGVTVTIETTEFPAKWVQDVMQDRNYQMTIVAHAEPMDIDIYSRDPYYFNYRNPAFDALMKKVQETTDPAEQAEIYGKAQTILADDVPALFLFVMPKLGVWNRKLKGLWENEPVPSNVLTNVFWEE